MGSAAPRWLTLFLAPSLCTVRSQLMAGMDPGGGGEILQGKPPCSVTWNAASGWAVSFLGTVGPQGLFHVCHAAPSRTRSWPWGWLWLSLLVPSVGPGTVTISRMQWSSKPTAQLHSCQGTMGSQCLSMSSFDVLDCPGDRDGCFVLCPPCVEVGPHHPSFSPAQGTVCSLL